MVTNYQMVFSFGGRRPITVPHLTVTKLTKRFVHTAHITIFHAISLVTIAARCFPQTCFRDQPFTTLSPVFVVGFHRMPSFCSLSVCKHYLLALFFALFCMQVFLAYSRPLFFLCKCISGMLSLRRMDSCTDVLSALRQAGIGQPTRAHQTGTMGWIVGAQIR